MNFTLLPGETKIDTWAILYIPPNGGKFNGKLAVTNQRLLYDAMYDASFKGYVAGAVTMRFGSEGYLEIDAISSIPRNQFGTAALDGRTLVNAGAGVRAAGPLWLDVPTPWEDVHEAVGAEAGLPMPLAV